MRPLTFLLALSVAAWSAMPAAQGKRFTVPELAKSMAPAVVFIGNVDAGGQRSASLLISLSHNTELAAAAQNSQSPPLNPTVPKAR